MRKSILLAALLSVAGCAARTSDKNTQTVQPVQMTDQEWQVAPAQSSVHFISIKKGKIGEKHDITGLSGRIGRDGKATVHLALNSVETHIDIRNERMRKFLFETDQWPEAVITASLNPKDYAGLASGQRVHKTIDVHVSLHGQEQDYEVPVWVSALAANKVLVESDGPILVEAADFGLEAGVEKLRELANLPEISPVVPVSFSLVFTH
ncbi:MAG TPA: YceI family protein [Hellea balneolensis]|uniref:YceI family protein n=1 Tax=Hellea balneolensis TaxID=287478 RepID=A0A7V5NW08_9PROT|nr:YceI family protein [Hellea balneolensis]